MNDSLDQEHDDPLVEDDETNDETMALEVLPDENEHDESQWSRRRPRFKVKEIVEYDDGSKILIFRTLKTTRRGKHAWARKIYYRVETKTMELEESSFVEHHLVKLLDFEPVPGENRIHLLNRRSWWEHGPQQLVIIFSYLFLVLLGIILAIFTSVPTSYVLGLLTLSAFVGSVIYFVVWMRWAYEYLLITNKRIGLIYRPPLGLVGTDPMSFLNKLTVKDANDQSWFANLIGKRNPAYSYGMLNLDTNAQEDDWLREIKFVREHKTVRELIARLTADAEIIEVRETDKQASSRELQDKAHRAMIKHFGDPDE